MRQFDGAIASSRGVSGSTKIPQSAVPGQSCFVDETVIVAVPGCTDVTDSITTGVVAM
jgi:hypothetical protein